MGTHMASLVAVQIENNRSSRDHWELFRDHRERVGELLRATPPGGRLCVLGAGNCNDLDLPALLAHCRELHLVDLDAAALEHGTTRQGAAPGSALFLHFGLDLTGMLSVMDDWSPAATVTDADLLACIEQPVQHVVPRLPGPFDVVASVCLLSQLVGGVSRTVGRDHPRFADLVFAIRAGHFNLLLNLIRPGGMGLLITDFVSSDTVPNLDQLDDDALPYLAETRNFFDGVNPFVLESLLRTAPMVAPRLAEVVTFPVWRWHFGPRTYLVWAARFRVNP